ncbi:Uncharacterised protein [Corynebacterium diphtheriae]|nr:Uncharacterised protein [Corynebacterium diphtheriae]
MIFMTGSSYRSRVFGYNFSRIVLIFAVLLLCVYFLTRRDQTAFITCGLLVSLAIFFNVGVLLNDEILRISVLGIPVSNVRLESLKGAEILPSGPILESQTFGVHFLDGTISFHAGSANILLHRNIGRPIRLTVKDPEEFLHLLAENSAIRPASHS